VGLAAAAFAVCCCFAFAHHHLLVIVQLITTKTLHINTMSTPAPKAGPGDMSTFNILHGFPEALVRGMRNSFLGDSDYHHLTQCESLEDVKLNLTESDYADALADLGAITPNELQKQAIEKVRNEQEGRIYIHFDEVFSYGTMVLLYTFIAQRTLNCY
jgi:hypothetical protein